MDIDDITHPLRLARGSHQPGSGKGCAMNVVSFVNGDEQITDFPRGSARPLSILVQASNDLLAGADGYLSPDNSLLALELAWQTMGTDDISDTVVHAWIAELLTSPTWGVVQYTKITAIKAIVDIAELHRAAASGHMPPIADWHAAERTARKLSSTLTGAGLFAVRAAYKSTALVNSRLWLTVDEVTALAVRAHGLARAGTTASRIVEVTRYAIRSWRELAALDDGQVNVSPEHDASVTLSAERDVVVTLAA